MTIKWKRCALLFPAAVCAFVLLPRSAAADPINTITVTFVVGGADASRAALGAQVDPTHGNDIGLGSFSFSTAIVPDGGGTLIRAAGLPVDDLSFSFAGTSWTMENAAVTDLRFAADRSLIGWALGGAPFGFTGLSINGFPDVGVVQPSFRTVIPQCCFNYTTADSYPNLGIFTGRLLSVQVTESPGGDPSPVPEPGSVLLVGSGAAALFARRRRSALND